ncbi:hypothetical protein [Paenibacillus hubeiensis]|uniref:hypothetical protein n=1 Tax=Paenibacillus hubeiensis TaxID=3077330 RepID=UPI0031B9CFD4
MTEKSFSDFYFALVDEIDRLIDETSKLRDTVPDEKESDRVSLNGELMGLRRARVAARNLYRDENEKSQ